jgi:hypothetical protein
LYALHFLLAPNEGFGVGPIGGHKGIENKIPVQNSPPPRRKVGREEVEAGVVRMPPFFTIKKLQTPSLPRGAAHTNVAGTIRGWKGMMETVCPQAVLASFANSDGVMASASIHAIFSGVVHDESSSQQDNENV